MDQELDTTNIPEHIAITMDGNRRWARSRGLHDSKGHEAGSETLEKIVEECLKLGVKTLTVYAMSTENLQTREKGELNAIFGLLRRGYNTKIKRLTDNGVRICFIGELEGLPKSVVSIIQKLKGTDIKNESMRLNVALNYSGKKELLHAIKDLVKSGVAADQVNEEMVEKRLYTAGSPDPELVIRTGGKIRLSNFLLWQSAYSELYFSPLMWPDFGPKQLREAIFWYQTQQRNFGK